MKIICNLPNASTLINGVSFEKDADGKMVSVNDVPEKMVPIFLSINGYSELVEAKKGEGEQTGPWDSGQGGNQDPKGPEGDVGITEKEQGEQTANETVQNPETVTQQPAKADKKTAAGKKS